MNKLLKYLFATLIILEFTSNFGIALPNCPTDPKALKDNCFGDFYYKDEEHDIQYQGEFQMNRFHGQGKISYSSSTNSYSATGEFKNGFLDGYVTFNHSYGTYKGFFKNNKFHGKGEYISKNGHKVVGSFKDDVLANGTGTMPIMGYSEGHYFTGSFKNGYPDGWGHMKSPEGVVTYVLFEEGKYIKYEYLIDTNGNYYHSDGHFIDDHRNKTVVYKAFNKLSDDERKSVQYALKDMGYYKLPIDGVWGKGTNTAIIEYTKSMKSQATFFNQSSTDVFLKDLAILGLDLYFVAEIEEEKKRNVRLSSNSSKKSYSSNNSSTTIGGSGSSYIKIGDTIFSSDGRTHHKIGDTIFSSDGTTHQKIGDTIFSSDGTTHQKIGNTIFKSDGTICQSIGAHAFCN